MVFFLGIVTENGGQIFWSVKIDNKEKARKQINIKKSSVSRKISTSLGKRSAKMNFTKKKKKKLNMDQI